VREVPSSAGAAALVREMPSSARDAALMREVPSSARDAALVREALAWDALQLPAATRASGVRAFAHDWPAYERAMSTRPQPIARAISVRVTAMPVPDAATEAVLLSWHMRARSTIEPIATIAVEGAP
jgi:hypothetical protein